MVRNGQVALDAVTPLGMGATHGSERAAEAVATLAVFPEQFPMGYGGRRNDAGPGAVRG